MKVAGLVTLAMTMWFGSFAQVQIKAEDAKAHIGEVVSLCGKIFSARYLQSSINKPTLLNLGGNYPNQLVTIAIFEADRNKFPFKPEEYYPNTEICVTGKLVEYRGMPEIIVQSPEQVKLQLETTTTATTAKPVTTPAKTQQPKAIPTPKAEPVVEPASEGQFDVTLTTDVNMRSGPGVENATIATLLKGSIVGVIRSVNGWSYVVVKKVIGVPGASSNGYIKNSVLK